jgi:glutathione S-transferase
VAATTGATISSLRVLRIPFSTNVERVALALAHKQLEVEWVDVDPEDRTEVVRLSGQERVPVLEHEGRVLHDSPVILEYLEERFPEQPLLPRGAAQRADVRIFCAWFNGIWKRPPNEIVGEEARAAPNSARLAALGHELRETRALFEDLLHGRDFLLGELSLADVTAFPFLKYAVLWQEGDADRFHEVLREHLRLDGGYPRLEAWVHRLDALPRA